MKKVYITDYFNDTKIEKKILGKTFKVICLNKKKTELDEKKLLLKVQQVIVCSA